jgi:hypothetical protein
MQEEGIGMQGGEKSNSGREDEWKNEGCQKEGIEESKKDGKECKKEGRDE